MIENRGLTGKQYESVNGVKLFRVEMDLHMIQQMYGKIGPFFPWCTTKLETASF
jgi:hypothetical protein